MDFLRASPFIFAVVPFEQVAIDFSFVAKARQLTSTARALQRAGENLGETLSLQPFAKPARVALAAIGQRQIGKPGVLARQTPCSLTVPREVNDGQRFTQVLLLQISGFAQVSRSSKAGTLHLRVH